MTSSESGTWVQTLRRVRWEKWLGPGWLWALFVVVVIAGFIASPYFLTTNNTSNILQQAAPLGYRRDGSDLRTPRGGHRHLRRGGHQPGIDRDDGHRRR